MGYPYIKLHNVVVAYCSWVCIGICTVGSGIHSALCVVVGKALEHVTLCRLAGHLNLYLDSQAGKLDRKAVAYPGSPREEFVNSKLAPKLAQQLKVSQTMDCVLQATASVVTGCYSIKLGC